MRNISITVDNNGRVTADTTELGYSGEHNAAELLVSFSEPETTVFSAADYFRIVIDGHYSDDLYLTDGTLTYPVPQVCMRPPRVQCQIVGYRINETEPEVIVKSEVFGFDVDCSEVALKLADSQPDVLERAMEACRQSAQSAEEDAAEAVEASNQAQTAAATAQNSEEAAAQAADSAKENAESLAASAQALSRVVQDMNNVSNAIKGRAWGAVVGLSDVSPLGHTLAVSLSPYEGSLGGELRVYGKNLMEDKRVYSDGEIYCGVSDVAESVTLPAGAYTFSAVCADEGVAELSAVNAEDDSNIAEGSGVNSITFELTEPTAVRFKASDERFTSEQDITFVQLEAGAEATEYTPYAEPVTYTPNADGTVEEVRSIFPGMTLVTNNAELTITVEYNRDINKVDFSSGSSDGGSGGLSAYEIAVQNGFKGTETQWLASLEGADGADGISVTHEWNGTTLIVTSASGTSSADLKGEKGDKGDKGDKGEDGTVGADYVVEQGTSGIWTYRKWNSGIAECWGFESSTVTTALHSNSNFAFSSNITVNYPFTITGPKVFIEVSGAAYMRDSFVTTGTTGFTYNVITEWALTSSPIYGQYHVMGLWK